MLNSNINQIGLDAQSINLRINANRLANRIPKVRIRYAKLNKSYHVEDEKGDHDSYFLISGDYDNLNDWGVVGTSIPKNIQTGIGKPYVITSTDFFPKSYYKQKYMHPNIHHFKRNLPHLVKGLDPDVYEDNLKFQEPYKVATMEKMIFNKEKDIWETIILREPQFKNKQLPPFCSIAIFQDDKTEADNKLTKWRVVHLAGLTESPAYGDQATYIGKCSGTLASCSFQFADSKVQADTDLELAKGSVKEAKEKFKEEDHPRAEDGRFGDKPGDKATPAASTPTKKTMTLAEIKKFNENASDSISDGLDKFDETEGNRALSEELHAEYKKRGIDIPIDYEANAEYYSSSLSSYIRAPFDRSTDPNSSVGEVEVKAAWAAAERLNPEMKKVHAELKTGVDNVNTSMKEKFDNADSMYRGMRARELDNIINRKDQRMIPYQYNYVSLTLEKEVGEGFGIDAGITIEIDAQEVRDSRPAEAAPLKYSLYNSHAVAEKGSEYPISYSDEEEVQIGEMEMTPTSIKSITIQRADVTEEQINSYKKKFPNAKIIRKIEN